MTSICPLTVVEASADVTGRSHSVAIALNNLTTDRMTRGTAVVRATGGGGVVAERGGVVAEAERGGGPVFL